MKTATLLLLLSAFALFSLGLIMVFNTTSAEVLDRSLEVGTSQALLRQILYGLLGIFFGAMIWGFGYQNILRLSPFLLFFCILLLALVFVPKIGQQINGAKRWISFFGLSFQPSELAKYLIPIYFIHKTIQEEEELSFKKFLKKLSILFFPVALIFLEPDNGTIAIIFVSMILLFFLTKVRWTYWALPVTIFLVVGMSVAYQMPHVRDRIHTFLHPESDIKGKGHQPYQAKIAAGSGGLWGKGLGESVQKLSYLPEARSDYIAAIYAEEFGFVGMLALISLYMGMSWAGLFIAFHAKDQGGFFLASILSFLLAFQAFLHLGVVSGLLPSKGTTLPFFSQGGTSLIMNSAALFLLVNIAKEAKRELSCRS